MRQLRRAATKKITAEDVAKAAGRHGKLTALYRFIPSPIRAEVAERPASLFIAQNAATFGNGL
jgi:hypothetical protein